MQIILNGHPMTDVPADAGTVEGLINAIREIREDCLVVGLKLNGNEVADAELFNLMQTSLAAEGTLELETDSTRRLACGVLAEVADGLRQARPSHVKVAELLAAGKNPEAMEQLSQLLSAWNAVEQSLQTVVSLVKLDLSADDGCGGDVGDVREKMPTTNELLGRLRDTLSAVREHLEARDMSALADVVEYDMPPLLDEWDAALARLRTKLK